MALTLPYEYDSTKFKLHAINILLQSINELPIIDEDDISELLEAQIAETVLDEVKRATLAEQWDFNTDEEYSMQPDLDGYIPVPANILDIVSDDKDVIMRDWRLYSRQSQSAKFTDVVTCKIIWDMDFNSLTHPLRYFITVKAARVFQARTIGDTSQYGYSQAEEQQAYLSARQSEGRTGDDNILTSLYGSDLKVWS